MNQAAPYNTDVHQQHMATIHSHPPSSGPAPALGHYSTYQPPMLQSGHQAYSSQPGTYSYAYPTYSAAPVSSSMSSMVAQPPPLSAMTSAAGQSALPTPQSYISHNVQDETGQVAPPGMKPRVTATLWEDEGSLCFQVEAKGVCVARREDNHMINGTKLLNVAGMTRGRRDGILKSEKVRHVVKIGPMHLKGVWIPFDRALDFANKEKITESLYPLFVHDIGALLYHPSNPNQPRTVGAGAAGALSAMDRRRNGQDPRYMAGPQTPQGPSLHHHSMSNPIVGAVPPPPQSQGRPNLDRAHTFPTPPASASSVMGMGPSGQSYEPWSNNSVPVQSQPLSIDTGLSNARSVPTTPASTPPGKPMHGTPYYPSSESYAPRPVYSAPAGQQGQYPPQQMRFGGPLQSSTYPKTEMAPPTKAGDEETEHEQDSEYTHSSAPYNGQNSYSYNPNTNSAPGPGESRIAEITNSPQQNGAGRATPRSATQGQWQAGYGAPPRSNTAPSSNLYNVMEPRDTANGATDAYYSSAAPIQNGTPSNKRGREDDDAEDDSKRQKTDGNDGGPVGGSPFSVNGPPRVIARGRR